MRTRIHWLCAGALAATCMLAACDASPSAIEAIALSAAQTSQGKALVNDVASAVQAENDLNLGLSLTSATPLSSYAVEDLSATASGQVPPGFQAFKQHKRFQGQQQFGEFRQNMKQARQKFLAMRSAFEARAKSRLNDWQSSVKSIATSSATASADDGSLLTLDSATMSISRPNVTQTQVITKTYAAATDGGSPDLIEVQGLLTRTFAKGTFTAYRDRANNSDGSFTVTYSATLSVQPASGSAKVKTVNWTETGSTDGSTTGSGTLVRFDGTTVDLTLSKTSAGSISTDADDKADNVQANVSQSDSSTGVTGSIGEPGKGTALKGAVSDNIPDAETADPTNGQ